MKPIEQMQTPDPRNVEHWRTDFPILGERVHGRPLVYLDNGATTQKPASVISAESAYYQHSNANVHRGVHLLSQRATDAFEAARAKIARFINARRPEEVVFVRGTTEAINLVAQSYARPHLKPGDEILISAMEHHSNIVPWQLVCKQTGAALRVVPIDDTGALDADAYERLFSERTRLVAMTHLANALGSINPVARIIAAAHARSVPVLLDGAQAIAHLPVDVRALDCDFYAFSGHKVYGPTGIGVLYAKAAILEAMPPWQGGGDMIRSVTFEKTEYNAIPWKFEAGTPNIAGAIALGAALDYVDSIGMEIIAAHENDLLAYATDALLAIPGLRLIGTARDKASILSFVLDGVHAHDVGTILDRHGVAVRAGHHCAMPVMQRFGIPATVRASLALYNTHQDIDTLIDGLGKVREIFGT
ncbi:cysteine desulfurase [Paraburkholderia sp. BL10I2N1]|uniref:cysteine desulfurase n=1 Tax=Paraburkholderia sp. BL10I2N1 TaxID=1938796 RepID=UPI00105D7664|nr:cysteine desulfurase [Paraburkholderia sp. BL10I2N1]TDN63149.1 L-selenocysteine selenide-lyase (L-alanine-forming) [Paraburkholderia sp. BL10I2N1]